MPKIKAEKTDKPVVHPEVTSEVLTLTDEVVTDLLGWTTEPEGAAWKDDYLLLDEDGNKVRCLKNPNNRPFYRSNAEGLAQEQLNRKWKLNGEPIIIDKFGDVHNGQHTLIGFKLAAQRFAADKHWKQLWKGGPFQIRKVVVYGIEADDATVNTIDTAKPRSLTDVLYRSGVIPKGLKGKDRQAFARVLDYAIRFVWSRTGAGDNAYAPRRTHSESMDFYLAHKGLLGCVKHVLDEEGDNKRVTQHLPLGTMAGLMYLMGASGTTDPSKYQSNRHEKHLDLEFMPQAEEFVTLLAGGSPDLVEVRKAIAHFDDKGGSSQKERLAVLVKAFLAWAGGDKMKADKLIPAYQVDGSTGVRQILETVTLHGIDLGAKPDVSPDDELEDDAPPEEVDPSDPSEEELEAAGMAAYTDEDPDHDEDQVPSEAEVEAAKAEAKKTKKGKE